MVFRKSVIRIKTRTYKKQMLCHIYMLCTVYVTSAQPFHLCICITLTHLIIAHLVICPLQANEALRTWSVRYWKNLEDNKYL